MVSVARFVGCCQLCGHEQKLPGDVLAAHGYTVRWGFFSGTCMGSGHLPFELSKDLIENAIAGALLQAEGLEKEAADLQKPATDPKATCRVHRTQQQSKHGEKPGYAWIKGQIESRPPRHGMQYVVIDDNGQEFYVHKGDYTATTALDAATYNNGLYSHSLMIRATQLREYAAWQSERVKNWMPQPLRPIKK